MPQVQEKARTKEPVLEPDPSGLWLRGTVISRRRRSVQLQGGKSRWVITIRVMAANEIISVDRWSDSPQPSDIPLVGQDFNNRVAVRVFQTKSGTRVSLQWGDNVDEGEF